MADTERYRKNINLTGAAPQIQINGVKVIGAPQVSTITATTGTLPVANGALTIANAASATNAELLEGLIEIRKVLYNHGLLTTI